MSEHGMKISPHRYFAVYYSSLSLSLTLSHTHTFSLSFSLSLSLIHTHTHTQNNDQSAFCHLPLGGVVGLARVKHLSTLRQSFNSP